MAEVLVSPAIINPLEELQDRYALMDLGGEIRVVDRARVRAVLEGDSSAVNNFYKNQMPRC